LEVYVQSFLKKKTRRFTKLFQDEVMGKVLPVEKMFVRKVYVVKY